MVCCFRPSVDDDDPTMLATVAISQPSRSRVLPAVADTALDVKRNRSIVGRKNSFAASAGSGAPGPQPRASLSLGPNGWGLGGGKPAAAEYKDNNDLDPSVGRNRLMSFLNREPSIRTGSLSVSRAGDVSSRSFRRKPPTGGSGSDDTDCTTDDAGGDGSGGGGGRVPSKEAIRARLKTVQPKRGILKKADNALDAAAGGDEEALLRIASTLAGKAPFGTGPGAAAGSPAATTTINTTTANGGANGVSASDVELDGLGTGGRATAWLDAQVAANANAASAVQISPATSRLAHSTSAGWLGLGTAPSALDSPVLATRAVSVRNRSSFFGPGSPRTPRPPSRTPSGVPAGSVTSPVVTAAASSPVELPDGQRSSFDRMMLRFAAVGEPSLRRQLSERALTPPSHILPVVPSPPPTTAASGAAVTDESNVHFSYIGIGTVGTNANNTAAAGAAGSVRSGRVTIMESPFPTQSQDAQQQQQVPTLPTGSQQQAGVVPSDRSQRGRRSQLTAARREEIMRSLPSGKSQLWYAHKLREILGTGEDGEAADGEEGVEEGGSGSGGCGENNNNGARRLSFSRFRSVGAADVARRSSLSDPPILAQRTASRLFPAATGPSSSPQLAISVRNLAASSRAGSGALAPDTDPVNPNALADYNPNRPKHMPHTSLPGSMPGPYIAANSEPVGALSPVTSGAPYYIMSASASASPLQPAAAIGGMNVSSAAAAVLLASYGSVVGIGNGGEATAIAGRRAALCLPPPDGGGGAGTGDSAGEPLSRIRTTRSASDGLGTTVTVGRFTLGGAGADSVTGAGVPVPQSLSQRASAAMERARGAAAAAGAAGTGGGGGSGRYRSVDSWLNDNPTAAAAATGGGTATVVSNRRLVVDPALQVTNATRWLTDPSRRGQKGQVSGRGNAVGGAGGGGSVSPVVFPIGSEEAQRRLIGLRADFGAAEIIMEGEEDGDR